MKKFLMLCVLAVTMLTGMNVQAADTKDAEAIMKKSAEVMNAKTTVKVDAYMSTVYGTKERMLTVQSDKNTKISYVYLMGMEFYVDEGKNLMYLYEPSERKWYVESTDGSDSTTDLTPNTDTTDAATNYTYKGSELYKDIRCDLIGAEIKDGSDTIYHAVYYINETTYEILFIQLLDTKGDVMADIEYSFPASVTLPQSVAQSAVMAPGSSVTVKGIEYTAPSQGNKCTVVVTYGKKASGNVTIPDKITFAGKEYKVTEIADKAFEKNKKIKKITLGKNIKTIGKQAFFKCKNLNQVTIRSTSVKKIGSKAFYGNAKNLKVQAPKSKRTKYRQLIEKSKTSSKLKM